MVTDDNGQFSTSAEWASHKHNTNAGKTSEDGVWFGTSEPDDSKGALPYDTYIIEEMRCESNKGFELIPPFEIVVSRNNLVIMDIEATLLPNETQGIEEGNFHYPNLLIRKKGDS